MNWFKRKPKIAQALTSPETPESTQPDAKAVKLTKRQIAKINELTDQDTLLLLKIAPTADKLIQIIDDRIEHYLMYYIETTLDIVDKMSSGLLTDADVDRAFSVITENVMLSLNDCIKNLLERTIFSKNQLFDYVSNKVYTLAYNYAIGVNKSKLSTVKRSSNIASVINENNGERK